MPKKGEGVKANRPGVKNSLVDNIKVRSTKDMPSSEK
jgi:hypothetical protein